jgi:hypothetical protein
MEVTDRLLPTLCRHVGRRADELTEQERTFELLGTRAGFARETRRCYERLCDARGTIGCAEGNSQSPALSQLLDLLANDTNEFQELEATNANNGED